MRRFVIMILILFSAFLLPRAMQAAVLRADSRVQTTGIGGRVTVAIVLNTEDQDINALEGAVIYPGDKLVLREVLTGSSIVHFWIEQPEVPESCSARCAIRWSGIVPGGYSGRDGNVFELDFETIGEGKSEVTLAGAKVLRNDGRGSVAALQTVNVRLAVTGESSAEPAKDEPAPDTTPPLPFTPVISRDPLIFDGKWFVAFAAEDKESGIAYYEVSTDGKNYVSATNPFPLQDERPAQAYVRVVDRAGNERVAVATRSATGNAMASIGNWKVVAGVGGLLVAVLGWFVFSRGKR